MRMNSPGIMSSTAPPGAFWACKPSKAMTATTSVPTIGSSTRRPLAQSAAMNIAPMTAPRTADAMTSRQLCWMPGANPVANKITPMKRSHDG